MGKAADEKYSKHFWAIVTRDQALFSFRSVNNIPAGKAKRKESLIQTFHETSTAHFFDWLTCAFFFGGGGGDKSSRHLEQASFVFPRARFCAKARLNAGHFSPRRQTKRQRWENCGWVAEKKENLKRWKVLEVSKLIYRLGKSLFQTAKGKSARHH